MNTCKTCKFRVKGYCESEFICESRGETGDENKSLIYDYSESGGFKVGDNFGCVHHEPINPICHASLLAKVLRVANEVYCLNIGDLEDCERFSKDEIKAMQELY